MNAQPRTVRHYCAVCWEPFYTPVMKGGGGGRIRCEKHSRPNGKKLSKRDLRELPVQPVSGIAIRRHCLACGEAFTARDEAALYCGLYCYARHNCHKVGIGKP